MSLRSRVLLVFVALGVLPALIVGVWGYAAGAASVEESLRGRAEERAERVARGVGRALEEQQARLTSLARGGPLREFVRAARGNSPGGAQLSEPTRAHLAAYFEGGREYFESVTCFDAEGRAILHLTWGGGGPVFQTENVVAGAARPDERAWRSTEAVRSPLVQTPAHGSLLLITAPVTADEPAPGGGHLGALVVVVRLGALLAASDGAGPRAPNSVAALDNATGFVAYHTNPGLSNRAAADAAPYFEPVARRMRAGEEGAAEYANEGRRWLASFRQVPGLGLSLAASEDYTVAAAGVRRAALWGVALALAAGLAGAALLYLFAGRVARDLRRLAAGAEGLAGGNLTQRVGTEGMTAETRELAETFNRTGELLSAHLTTTSETKQFESFLRLSAMLSHDLKNAVAGLSLLVSNMEKHIHREDFREEAVASLRHATDKLRRLAARLSEPVMSLSGEYRREARPTDLVPVIRRVLAANVEPHAPLYQLDARLPDALVATVEPARMENVFENLVINGVEAMGPAGGRLTVEAGRLGEGLVFFSVSDTGVGMTPEFVRTRLYRPFSTTKAQGIGLGLYTCREVVEAHGGRLEVESQLGVGTRFRVVLPSRLLTSGGPRSQ